jgi:dephospho-CoA kinase
LRKSAHVVIALRGAKGAGKSAVARALAERLRWPLVVTGDIVRQWALRSEGVSDAKSVRHAAEHAREGRHGVMGAVLHTIWPQRALPNRLVIDSVREPADHYNLHALGYTIILVSVVASFETRLARMIGRGRSDDMLTRDGLRTHDEWEKQLGFADLHGDLEIEIDSADLDIAVSDVISQLHTWGINNV